jgi:hypothetical protein
MWSTVNDVILEVVLAPVSDQKPIDFLGFEALECAGDQ